MMFYPEVETNNNQRGIISNWLGYNHNYRISDGEFYDMENMSTDEYPLLVPRQARTQIREAENTFRGMLLTGGYLAYVDGNVFHYADWSIDLTPLIDGTSIKVTGSSTADEDTEHGDTELTLVRFGAYVLIYQLSNVNGDAWKPVWVNIESITHEAGLISPVFKAANGTTIKYTLSKADGSDYGNVTKSATEPSNPTTGKYWLSTNPDSSGLYVYYNNSWEAVATTYVRIEVPGAKLLDYFSEGDVVDISNIDDEVKDLNESMYIHAITDTYIVVTGIISDVIQHTTNDAFVFTISRKEPTLDYICVDKNRLWGCRYGYVLGEGIINEIYASKLGDFRNWYSYQGISTDSYALTIGVPGVWTGCCSYGGYPTFFKDNAIIRIYGSYPSEYQMTQIDGRGVQFGSYKSLAIVGETLFYKSPTGVMSFDGSLPRSISASLGKDYYDDGVAASCGNKYYIELSNKKGVKSLFVYDTETGLWSKESNIRAIQYSGSIDGQLYAITDKDIFMMGRENFIHQDSYLASVTHLYEHNTENNKSEGIVEWYAETGDMGYDYPDFKYVSRITLRAYVPFNSEIQVQISYDDRPYDTVGVIHGISDVMTQTLAIMPYRCDHYKLKFTGRGKVRFYSLTTTLETGSEEYGYKN